MRTRKRRLLNPILLTTLLVTACPIGSTSFAQDTTATLETQPRFTSLDRLVGRDVINNRDYPLGHVDGFLLSLQRGRVTHLVLSVLSLPSNEMRPVAVPFELTEWLPLGPAFRTPLSAEEIRRLPHPDEALHVGVEYASLAGRRLKAGGEVVGVLDKVIINPDSGALVFGVFTLHDGAGDVPVPWSAIKLADHGFLATTLTEDSVRRGPRLPRAELLALRDPDFRATLHARYGILETEDRSRPSPSLEVEAYLAGRAVSLSGIVRRILVEDDVEVQVTTPDETFDVEVGPHWFLRRQPVALEVGDTVEIDGRMLPDRTVKAAVLRTEEGTLALRDADSGAARWNAFRSENGERQTTVQ